MTGHESTGADTPTDGDSTEIVTCDECNGAGFTVLRHSDGSIELECTNCPTTMWGKAGASA